METNKIEKYLQTYIDDVIEPKLNSALVGEDDEPIKVTVYKVHHAKTNPRRIVFFLDMEPDWTQGSVINKINSDISSFFKLLGIDKELFIYWNKRPLF